MVTASGLAFLGSALDCYLRAYETATGRVLWQARLPAGDRRHR
jgi:quinoprotein glucose dehydrogenase